MDTNPLASYNDEIDLRKIIHTLLRNWKLLFIGMLLGTMAGYFYNYWQQKTPIYTASSQVLIDQNIFYPLSEQPSSANQSGTSTSNNLTALLLSDTIRQKAANLLGRDATSLPAVSITPDSTNNSIYAITLQTTNSQDAAPIVNAWADASIDWANQIIQLPNDAETKALASVEKADQSLVEYLNQNGLSQLTWSDLEIITGIGSSPNILQPSLQPLPDISSVQRLEIAKLMQARITAQAEYDYSHSKAIQVRYALSVNKPMVLMYATVPMVLIKPSMVRNAALGAGAGLVLAMCWVFLHEWWKKGDNKK